MVVSLKLKVLILTFLSILRHRAKRDAERVIFPTITKLSQKIKILQEQFKKFYNMKPYLLIEEEEWKDIMQKYEKEDVVEELAKVLHTYPAPL